MKRLYQRHLPHQIPERLPIFVTWSLKGALPKHEWERIREEKYRLPTMTSANSHLDATGDADQLRKRKIEFGWADDYLDGAQSGPLDLKDPRAAKIVEDAILYCSPARHVLYAWCVMANHVHLLSKPIVELGKLMQSIKGFTAREINRVQGMTGRRFWQDESYDHWPRDEEEFQRILFYIENNPVKAKLCRSPEEWKWSSARHRAAWPAGTPYPSSVRSPYEESG